MPWFSAAVRSWRLPRIARVLNRYAVLLPAHAGDQHRLIEQPVDHVIIATHPVVHHLTAVARRDQERWRLTRFHTRRHLQVDMCPVVESSDWPPRYLGACKRVGKV